MMKSRQGFVSNSSSSSFIIRGIKLDMDQIATKLGIPVEIIAHKDDYDIMGIFKDKFPETFGKELTIKTTANFFGGDNYGDYIIGKSIGYLEDGEVYELEDNKERDDALTLIFEKIGFLDDIKLNTYIQMISNDNY